MSTRASRASPIRSNHETEAYAEAFLARHVLGAPQVRLELRIGNPAIEVLGVVESLNPELVAVGWPQSADHSRGIVAREILDGSPVPVLLIALN